MEKYLYLLMLNEHPRGCTEDTPLQSQSPAELYPLIPVEFELAGDEVELLNPSPSAISRSKPCSLVARI